MLNIYIIDLNHKTKKLAEKLTRTVRIHLAQIYKGKLQEEKKTLKQQLVSNFVGHRRTIFQEKH